MAHTGAALIRQLAATHDGDPWYGSSRMSLLKKVRYTQAAAQPVAGGHSVWGLVLHMTAWTNEVRRRLGGAAPAEPLEGDWPPVAEVSAAAWDAARQALTTAHAQLVTELEALPESRWQERVGQLRDPGRRIARKTAREFELDRLLEAGRAQQRRDLTGVIGVVLGQPDNHPLDVDAGAQRGIAELADALLPTRLW